MKKRFMSLLLAVIMVVSVMAPVALAEGEKKVPSSSKKPENTKVIVTKVKLKDLEGYPKDADNKPGGYDGTKIMKLDDWFIGKSPTVMEGIAFRIYKVEENGQKTLYKTPEGQDVFLTDKNGEISVVLPNGTYEFVEDKDESTYVGAAGETVADQAAVPFTIELPMQHANGNYFDETHPLYVYPKNTEAGKPDNNKELDGDAADETVKDDMAVKVGDEIPYVVTSTIKAGSTYKMLAWNDRMSDGLTFNEDVEITTSPDLALVPADYDLSYSNNGFVLKLTNSGLKKLAQKTAGPKANFKIEEEEINGENTAVTFTLKYSAFVNNDAVVENPLENTNSLHYGNNPGYTPEPGDNNPEPQTEVTEITVNKSFKDGTAADGTVQSWPEGLEITLQLQKYNAKTNAWEDVADKTLTLNSTTTSGKFTGLDKKASYRVVETLVKGWVPNYEADDAGNLTIVNKKNPNPTPITPEPVIVRTGGEKFKKIDPTIEGEGLENGLKNAIFLVTNEAEEYLFAKPQADKAADEQAYKDAEAAYKEAIDYYNNLSEENQTDIEYKKVTDAQVARDAAFKAMKAQWEFKAATSAEAAATAGAYQLVSGADGTFEITGLDYGKYKLVELVPPANYAKLTSPKDFTISANSYSDDMIIEIKNTKVTIPQTGGMGTIILTVAGIALMATAVIALRRNRAADRD